MRLIALILLLLSYNTYAQVSTYSTAVISSYQAGIEAYEQHKLTAAKEHFATCIETDQTCFEGYLGLSQVYFSEKNYKEALNYGKKGAELQPFDLELTGILGKCHHHLGEYKKAENLLKRALSIGNESVENTTCLALSLQRLSNYEEALHYFKRAISQAPNDYAIWFDRGKLFTEIDSNEMAIRDFEQALKLSPENAVIFGHLAQTYFLLDQNLKAFEYIELGLKSADSTDKVRLLLLKGHVYQNQGDLEQAHKIYEAAYNMEHSNGLVLVHQAAVLIDMENFAQAVEKCNAAIAIDPDLMEAYFNRGIANEMLRDIEGACSDWQKAFVLGSNSAIEYLNGPVCNE